MKRVPCSPLARVSALCMMTLVAHAELAYRLTPIEDPNNPATLHTIGFNNKGEVVGFVEEPRTRAFLWRKGTYTDLGNVIDPSASGTEAVGINDRSDIIGHRIDVRLRPFLLRHGRRIDIQPDDAVLYGLNNRNQITGVSQARSFVWQRGRTTFLEDLPGTSEFGSTPRSINDRGVIAGTSGSLEESRAVIWKEGDIMALALLPGATRAEGRDTNNWEQVIGTTTIAGDIRAFLWTDGATTELPLIDPQQTTSFAWAINDWGTVVGYTARGSEFLATVWVAGKALDLNTLIASNDPLKPSVHLDQAFFINDRGQIVAMGRNTDVPFLTAFLLTPTYRPQMTGNHE